MRAAWANNPNFRQFPQNPVPGQDPIIGQTHAESNNPATAAQGAQLRQTSGLFSAESTDSLKLGDNGNNGEEQGEAKHEWVEARGGEYFFVPSLSSLVQYIAL